MTWAGVPVSPETQSWTPHSETMVGPPPLLSPASAECPTHSPPPASCRGRALSCPQTGTQAPLLGALSSASQQAPCPPSCGEEVSSGPLLLRFSLLLEDFRPNLGKMPRATWTRPPRPNHHLPAAPPWPGPPPGTAVCVPSQPPRTPNPRPGPLQGKQMREGPSGTSASGLKASQTSPTHRCRCLGARELAFSPSTQVMPMSAGAEAEPGERTPTPTEAGRVPA